MGINRSRGGAVALALVLASLATTGSSAGPIPPCGWQRAYSPQPAETQWLKGVSVLESGKAWTVGDKYRRDGSSRALAMRWNRDEWRVKRSADPQGNSVIIDDVEAIAAGDVWVVGSQTRPFGGAMNTHIEHFNGRRWKTIASPNPGASLSALEAVDSSSHRNVWAVGAYWDSAGTYHTMILAHRRRRGWAIAPRGDGIGILHGIDVQARDQAWAVGVRPQDGHGRTLTMRMGKNGWHTVPSPNLSPRFDALYDVYTIGRRDAWAVGVAQSRSGYDHPLILHWNGKGWKIVPFPQNGVGELHAVSAGGRDDVWFGGTFESDPVIYHWDGTTLEKTYVPDDVSHSQGIQDIDTLRDGRPWAVGDVWKNRVGYQTLTLRWMCS